MQSRQTSILNKPVFGACFVESENVRSRAGRRASSAGSLVNQRPVYCYHQGVDPDIKALVQVLIEGQIRTDRSVADLTAMLASDVELSDARFGRHEESSNERFSRLEEAHVRTEEAIANLALNSDARLVRIEESLDGLIRAITHEHSNGKGHP